MNKGIWVSDLWRSTLSSNRSPSKGLFESPRHVAEPGLLRSFSTSRAPRSGRLSMSHANPNNIEEVVKRQASLPATYTGDYDQVPTVTEEEFEGCQLKKHSWSNSEFPDPHVGDAYRIREGFLEPGTLHLVRLPNDPHRKGESVPGIFAQAKNPLDLDFRLPPSALYPQRRRLADRLRIGTRTPILTVVEDPLSVVTQETLRIRDGTREARSFTSNRTTHNLQPQ
ncbi:hypothetical protein L596_014366 [Steinernema carpocapsae]|uniref:Uncharacterized protein n=1 Tax=Steinernema carpocapsae TaxID=34508 RepID=A0A4U5NBQ0_STECR|nr:hypothetical protein L596_014366 [Steinernema carpocapsae]